MPDVGSRSPTTNWRRVVLPAPFGPTSPTTLPAGMERVQFWSAHLRPKRFVSAVVSTAAFMRLAAENVHATPSEKWLRYAVR